jgi:Cu+-exporting ATPase
VSIVISPELAGLMMAVSSITVTLNTLLLKRFKPSIRHTDKPTRGAGQPHWQAAPAAGGK